MTKALNKPTPSLKTIEKKKNADSKSLKKELDKGTKEEKEHTSTDEVAEEIALDHLNEDPKYYSKLDKIKKESNTVKLSKKRIAEIINEEVEKFKLEKLHEEKYGKLLNEFSQTFIEALEVDSSKNKQMTEELKKHLSLFTHKLLGNNKT